MAAKGILKIKIAGDDAELKKTLDGSKKKLSAFQKELKGVGESWPAGSFAKKAIAGFAAFEVIKKATGFMVECAQAAREDANRFTALQQVMKNQGQATAPLIASMKEYIDQSRLATGVSEDDLVPALARLQAATRDVAKTQEFGNLAMDIATARHLELGVVATALGKAYQGNVTGLQRLGVAVKDNSGKALEFDQILSNLKRTYGGTAKAIANQDPWKRLGQAWEILKEKIGEAILPAINRMVPAITQFVSDLGKAIQTGNWEGIGAESGRMISAGVKGAISTAGDMVVKPLLDKFTGGSQFQGGTEFDRWFNYLQHQVDAYTKGKIVTVGQIRYTPAYKQSLGRAPSAVKLPMQEAVDRALKDLQAKRGVYGVLARDYFGTPTQAQFGKLKAAISGVTTEAGQATRGVEDIWAGVNRGSDVLLALEEKSQAAAEAQQALYDATFATATASDLATSKIAAQAVAMQSLNEVTDAMKGTYDTMVNPGSIWEEAKGKLSAYLKLMREHVAAYKNYVGNVKSISAQYGQTYGDAIKAVMKMPEAAEIFAQLKNGTPIQVKEFLDGINAKLQAENPVINAQLNAMLTPQPRTGEEFGKIIAQSTFAGYSANAPGPKMLGAINAIKWDSAGRGAAGRFVSGWGNPTVTVRVSQPATARGGTSGNSRMYYDEGGPIPGSGPVPIVAHGGEYVLTKGDTDLMRSLISSLSGGGGTDNSAMVALLYEIKEVLRRMPADYRLAQRVA